MSGFNGLVGSGFSRTKVCSPPGTTAPLGPVTSATSTRTCACAFVDVTNTVRELLDPGGTVTSNLTAALEVVRACENEARPPGGWLAITIRNVFATFVVLCTDTTKACGICALSGFEFPGERTS